MKKITELLVQREDEVSGSQMVKHLWKNIAESMQNKEKDSSISRRIDPMLFDLITECTTDSPKSIKNGH